MLATKPFLALVRHGFVQCFRVTFKGRGRFGINSVILRRTFPRPATVA